MYQLNLLEGPRKFLRNLRDKKLLLNLCHKIEELKCNPFLAGSKKLKENLGYRLRVGDHRILYTVDKTVQIIEIYKIGHRRDAYR